MLDLKFDYTIFSRKGNINIRTEEKKTVVEYVNSDILSLTTQIDLGILIPPLNLTFYHKV